MKYEDLILSILLGLMILAALASIGGTIWRAMQ